LKLNWKSTAKGAVADSQVFGNQTTYFYTVHEKKSQEKLETILGN
jgi:hypothetical protein